MKGVVVYFSNILDDEVSLQLDDVKNSPETDSKDWESMSLFTSTNLNLSDLRKLNLSKEQFAEIGENILIRLMALEGERIENV